MAFLNSEVALLAWKKLFDFWEPSEGRPVGCDEGGLSLARKNLASGSAGDSARDSDRDRDCLPVEFQEFRGFQPS